MKPKYAVVYDPHYTGCFYLDGRYIFDIPIFAINYCYELNQLESSNSYRVVKLDFTFLDYLL